MGTIKAVCLTALGRKSVVKLQAVCVIALGRKRVVKWACCRAGTSASSRCSAMAAKTSRYCELYARAQARTRAHTQV